MAGGAAVRRSVAVACEPLELRRLWSVTVGNNSFETPAETSGSNPSYAYDPTGATWSFTGNAGIERTGSAFGAATAPNGSQAAFLQSSYAKGDNILGAFSQSLTVPAGTYTVSFYAAERSGKTLMPVEFFVDGVEVGGAVSPSSTAFQQFTTSSFTIASTGSHTITFTGQDNPTADADVFIDLVTVNTVIAPPTVATAAAASPSTVTGTTTALSVLGASAGGASTLTYTWAATGTPPAAVSFSANGTNAAKATTATFAAAGTYTLQATITDAYGSTATSSVVVTVRQTLTSIAVTPAAATVYTNATQQFTATALDQFGLAMATQPTIAWAKTGVGSLGATGLYTPPSTAGSATVRATGGGLTSNAAAVSVLSVGTPTVTTAAAASPSAVTGTTTGLSVTATDGNGGTDLTYAWSLTGTPPAPVTYAANGTAAARATTATFAAAGTYNFVVTVTSATGQSATSGVSVVVAQTATGIVITPGSAAIAASGTKPFAAVEYDQFGTAMAAQPTFAWTANGQAGTSGSTAIGSISASTGLYTASTTPGVGTVTANAGGLFDTVQVTVGGATIADGTVTLSTFGTNAYYAVDTNSCAIATDNLWTDAASGYQFAAFYTTAGEIMIARRTVGGSVWQAYDSGINDSAYTSDDHDVISIAVDTAGYMHMSWGMHNIPLNYAISTGVVTGAQLASVPFTIQTASTAPTLFALAANDTPGLTSDTNEVTYPQFYAIPNSPKLLFAYRNGGAGGGSGNGDEYIDVYTPATGTWSHTLFIDGEHTSVNAYLNRLTYDANGNLIATWTWRASPNFQTNSNIMYAQSPDDGTSWYTQGGVNQYALPIIQTDGTNNTYSAADRSVAQVIETIPEGSSFINQTSMTVDDNNNPIIATYLAPGTASGNYNLQYMVYYYANGQWNSSQVTDRTSDTAYDSAGNDVRDLGRPDVLVDKQGRVLVVTRSEDTSMGAYDSPSTPGNDIVIYYTTTAALDAGTPDWQSVTLDTTNMGDYEPTYDQNLWASTNELSMVFEPIDLAGETAATVQTLDWNEQAYFNAAPTVATPAAASPSPVTGTSTTLSVLGADNNGAANLTYTWSTTGTPPAAVSFTANGTNAAQDTTATFTAAGKYNVLVTIANAYGYSTTSAVTVTVAQTLTKVAVSPATASVGQSMTRQFSAVAEDQFGSALVAQPTFAWTATGTGNTVSSTGLFTAGSTATGTSTVTATAAGVSGSASVTILVGTALTLTNNGPSTANATQALSYTAKLSGGVPDGATVTLEDASNGDAVLATGTTSGGSVTFTLAAGKLLAGAHDLFAAYAGNAVYAASQSAVLVQTEQVVVTAVTVNGNLAGLAGAQRSMVNSIVYTFSEAVKLGAGAFGIAIHSGQTGTVPTLVWTALNPNADGSSTQWVVTFTGSGVVGSSIANGVYDITMNAAAVTSDANPAVAAQARATDTFYRLYGDYSSTARVSTADYNYFLATYGLKSGTAGYLAAFDYGGTGAKISTADYSEFLADYGLRYTGFSATI